MVALSRSVVWPAALPAARPRLSRCLGVSARCLAPCTPRSFLSRPDHVLRGGMESPRRRPPPPRLPLPAAALPRGAVELLDAVPGKSELLTPRLDTDVRQRAEKAIELRGGRVTIGDVASTAGLRLDQAEEAVRALAADSQATLQVRSADGGAPLAHYSASALHRASYAWSACRHHAPSSAPATAAPHRRRCSPHSAVAGAGGAGGGGRRDCVGVPPRLPGHHPLQVAAAAPGACRQGCARGAGHTQPAGGRAHPSACAPSVIGGGPNPGLCDSARPLS